jgi:hypothetical protein
LSKATWIGGSASRVMTEDGRVGVGEGAGVGVTVVSDTCVEGIVGAMEGTTCEGDSEGDWLVIVDIGKGGVGIGAAFCGEVGKDGVGVRSVESC